MPAGHAEGIDSEVPLTLPLAAALADATAGALLLVAGIVSMTGRLRFQPAGVRLSISSPWRALLCALVILALRHWLVPRRPIHRRFVHDTSDLNERRLFADNNHLLSGLIKNKAGKFVKASPQTVSKAGANAEFKKGESLLAADIWNQPGDEAYPIASFTYLIVYKDLKNLPDKDAAQALANFLWWSTHEGQRYATDLGYAPLAPELQAKVEKALKGLTYRGESLKIGE